MQNSLYYRQLQKTVIHGNLISQKAVGAQLFKLRFSIYGRPYSINRKNLCDRRVFV